MSFCNFLNIAIYFGIDYFIFSFIMTFKNMTKKNRQIKIRETKMIKRTFMILLFCVFLFSSLSTFASWLDDLRIHGFISQGYMKSNHNNYLARTSDGTFEFAEFGLNFQTQVSDRLRIGAQLFSRDLGYVGDHNIVLDWAYGDYTVSDSLGVRFGKIKMPYGFHNQGRDVDLLRPTILLPLSTYSEDMRASVGSYVGANFYGTHRFGKMGRFEYEMGYGALVRDIDLPFVRGLFNTVSSLIHETNPEIYDRTTHGRPIWGGFLRWNTPLSGLRLGFNFGQTKLDHEGWAELPFVGVQRVTFTHDYYHNHIYSAEYTIGNLVLTTEYHIIKTDFIVSLPGLGVREIIPVDPMGYYAQISYRVTDWLELSTYYTEYYRDKNDKEGENMVERGLPDYFAWQKDLCFSARFDLSFHWLFKVEVHRMSGAACLHTFENPDGIEEDFTLFAVKTTFNF